MDIILYTEENFDADIVTISEELNKICKTIQFSVGKSVFKVNSEFIKHPDTYTDLGENIDKESKDCYKVILLTDKQYDNNYFFVSHLNKVIISFYGWNNLTNLSKNNGIIYFVADLIALDIDNSFRHHETTGCIYDFGWNKKSVDLEMRNAFICSNCLSRISAKTKESKFRDLFIDLKEILNVLGNISKWNMDIVKYWSERKQLSSNGNSKTIIDKPTPENYDVFLAHNSIDKDIVEEVCNALKNRGLKPWLDKGQIPPGRWFQDIIQDTIQKISSAAIFIGKNNLGKWQAVELRSFISQCVEREIPIIPVLLPEVESIPPELVFLSEFNWVRFKNKADEKEAIDNLVWGITGIHPERT